MAILRNIANKYKVMMITGLLSFFCSIELSAFEIFSGSNAGISAYYFYDNHSAELKSIEEIGTCCPKNLDGSGKSFLLSLDYGIKLAEYSFVRLSFGFADRYSELRARETELINLDSVAIDGVFSHNLDFNYQSLFFSLGYQQDIFGTVGFGAYLSYEMPINNRFDYSENLLIPSDMGYFPDSGTRKRNIKSGEFSGMSSGIAHIGLFISKEYPLDTDFLWIVVPKAGFNQLIGNLDKLNGWSYNSFFFGISIIRNNIF